jgi:Spy/CpxP family protein refolding chaperone
MMLAGFGLQAQPRGRAGERIHAIKVGYLTDRLKLTPEQAAAFWPVYNRYESEVREAKRAFRQKYRGGAADEAEANEYIDDQLDYQQQVLAINRRYKDRMLAIISPQQLAALYEAERDFRKLLLQQLRERRRR